MHVIEGLGNLDRAPRACGVCVGAFDGLHVGHQYLLSQLCALSAERGYRSAIVTFEPIPSQYFAPPDSPPRRLVTRDERIALAASLCCELMLILHFDETLRRWDARSFVEQVLVQRLEARLLVASGTHTLGFDQVGPERLPALCAQFGLEVHHSPVLQLGDLEVSSSEIRRLLWEGRAEQAAGLLGRHYSLTGEVVSGRGVGTQLGFPTANLRLPPEKLVPADGVYAGLACAEAPGGGAGGAQQRCAAAISIGTAPTFGLADRLIEAHLLGEVPPDLVGRPLRLEFLRRLRGQRKFADAGALARQIALDVQQTQALAAALLPEAGGSRRSCPLPQPAGGTQ